VIEPFERLLLPSYVWRSSLACRRVQVLFAVRQLLLVAA